MSRIVFFPKKEESFDVDLLMQEVLVKKNIRVVKANALHGFADPWSSRYCKETGEKMLAMTFDFVDGQRRG